MNISSSSQLLLRVIVKALLISYALLLACLPANAQDSASEGFYIQQVEPIVQRVCITCHWDNGVARGSSLIFTEHAASNHISFISYINRPIAGAGGQVILDSIVGGAAHGGGAVLDAGGEQYQAFEHYIALVTSEADMAAGSVLRVSLEEPVNGEVHTGVGNLRSWAVATAVVHKVEVWIDGEYVFDAPYGGLRSDVGSAFPDVPGAQYSGFSLAYNYSVLTAGQHTVAVVVQTETGLIQQRSATFNVVRFANSFINDDNAVTLDTATCRVQGDEIAVTGGQVGGDTLDFLMVWRTPEQGFEIVRIR